LRILVDTNIIISAALFPNGKVSLVLSHLFETHVVVIASYSIEEAKQVFLRKFPDKLKALESFLATIDYELFETPKKIDKNKFPFIRDIYDLPVLASAIISDVDILITGDKDFDNIKLNKPLIFTPNEYYEFLNK
jgi:putative PIN family toxin of toxin-antitoxin system